jgi:serine/threonine protein kinase
MSYESVMRWSAQSGAKVLDLELGDCLGAGGMGAVFKASQGERLVAVKVLTNPVSLEHRLRFQREAEALARVDSHPGVLRIHAVHTEFDPPFLILELVQGQSLKEHIRALGGARLPLSEALRIAEDLSEALEHLHKNGIVHRDLKAANVLIEASSGRVRLADFGLASIEGMRELTRTGEVLGTPGSMAPEQIAGQKVTPAADWWAFGVLLFELLTSRPLFDGASAFAIMNAVLTGPIPRPSATVPELPESIDSLYFQLLQREPAQRLTDSKHIREALARARGGKSPSKRKNSRRLVVVLLLLSSGLSVAIFRQGAPQSQSNQKNLEISTARALLKARESFRRCRAQAQDLRATLREAAVHAAMSRLRFELPGGRPQGIEDNRLAAAKTLISSRGAMTQELPQTLESELSPLLLEAEILIALSGEACRGEIPSALIGRLQSIREGAADPKSEAILKALSEQEPRLFSNFSSLYERLLDPGKPSTAREETLLEQDYFAARRASAIILLDSIDDARRLAEVQRELQCEDLSRLLWRQSMSLRIAVAEIFGMDESRDSSVDASLFVRVDQVSRATAGYRGLDLLIESFRAQRNLLTIRARIERTLTWLCQKALEHRNIRSLRDALRQYCVASSLGSSINVAKFVGIDTLAFFENDPLANNAAPDYRLESRLEFFVELGAAGLFCEQLLGARDVEQPATEVILNELQRNPRLSAAVELAKLRIRSFQVADCNAELNQLALGTDNASKSSCRSRLVALLKDLSEESLRLVRSGRLKHAAQDQAIAFAAEAQQGLLKFLEAKEQVTRDFDPKPFLDWSESALESQHLKAHMISRSVTLLFGSAQVEPRLCLNLVNNLFPVIQKEENMKLESEMLGIEALPTTRRQHFDLGFLEIVSRHKLGEREGLLERAAEVFKNDPSAFERSLLEMEVLMLFGEQDAVQERLDRELEPLPDQHYHWIDLLQSLLDRYIELKPKRIPRGPEK